MWGRALKIAETKKRARLTGVASAIGHRLRDMGQYGQAGQLLLGSGDTKVHLRACTQDRAVLGGSMHHTLLDVHPDTDSETDDICIMNADQLPLRRISKASALRLQT